MSSEEGGGGAAGAHPRTTLIPTPPKAYPALCAGRGGRQSLAGTPARAMASARAKRYPRSGWAELDGDVVGCSAAGDFFADEWDQLFAELGGVLERFEAADEETGDAQVVVAQQRLGDLLRGADEGGGIAAGAGGRGDGHPEAVVEDLALGGEIEQALRAGRGGGAGRLAAVGDDPLQVVVRLV